MAEVGNSYKDPLTQERKDELRSIAQKILQPGKGILAADESTGFLSLENVGNSGQLNRLHREALRVDWPGEQRGEQETVPPATLHHSQLWREPERRYSVR